MRSLTRIFGTTILLFAIGRCWADTVVADPRLLQARDVFGLQTAGDAQISPDGTRVVYARGSYDIMTDRARSHLWIINTDGSEHRPLYSDANNYSSPRWSPDGRRLAFISSAAGSPQLFVRWMDSGQTALLTNLTETPGNLTWSPDGRSLAFTQRVTAPPPLLATAPEKPEGANWAAPVTLIDSVVYRADGEGYLKNGFSHVFIVPTDGGAPRQLTSGNFNHDSKLAFTPDGRKLLLSANRNADWEYDSAESEIFALDIDSGALTALTHRKGPDNSPAVSPDGRLVAYTGFDDRLQGYQVTHLYVMNADGSDAHRIAPNLDRDVEDPTWAADGRSLYFVHDDAGMRKITRATLDGRVQELATGVGSSDVSRPYTGGGFSVARTGHVAFVRTSTARPGDVAVSTGSDKTTRELTRINAGLLDHKILGRVEHLNWKSSHDARRMDGWLVTPPNFDAAKKYPLILEIHGGPFTAYGPNFSVEIQRYAAAGYMVLYCNPRGSTSYGEEFGNLIHHAYPGNDYDDLISGVDAVTAKGNVDSENLFVTGGSGGGVLTAWIVGKTQRFRAAVVAKPVINWTSFVLTADQNNFFYRYWFAAPPWEAQSEYWRRSPLSLVGNVSTPTMLLTGESDYRTPISETEQFYQALKLRKVPTMMVRVPGASHGLTARPSNFIAKTDNILAWFERYRKR